MKLLHHINACTCVYRRQPSTVKEHSKVAQELSVSANVAYGQVKLLAESSDSGMFTKSLTYWQGRGYRVCYMCSQHGHRYSSTAP